LIASRPQDERRHFVNFDRCVCGAYQYLAVRILRKSLTVYLIHIRGKERRYLNVAHVKNSTLDIHAGETTS
jgi:hypothetical protein